MSRSLHKSNKTSKPKRIYTDTPPTPKQTPLTLLLTNSPVLITSKSDYVAVKQFYPPNVVITCFG